MKSGKANTMQNDKVMKIIAVIKGMSWIDRILLLLCIFVLVSQLIFTFTGANLLINSDTATANILAEEIVRTHSYFPKGWTGGHDLWVFFLHTFIVLFTLFSDDYILMHSWASTLFIFMAVLSCIYCSRKTGKNNSWLVSIPLLFCSISDEYSKFVFGQCAYLPQMLYVFFFISLYIDSVDEKEYHIRSKNKFILLLLLITFIGLGGVRSIQVFGLPLLGTILIPYFMEHYKDDLKTFFRASKSTLFKVFCVSASIALGYLGHKILSSQIIFITGKANGRFTDFNISTRIDTFINDFFSLFGFSYSVHLFSSQGLSNIIKLFIGLLIFIVFPILQIKNIKKDINCNKNVQKFTKN